MLNKFFDIISQLQESLDHSGLLSDFEIILCAGLESRQKYVANATIKFWNFSFGVSQQELQYPDRLKEALLKLRAITVIELPSLPASLVSEAAVNERQLMDFEESQFDPGSFLNTSVLHSVFQGRQTSSAVSSPSRRRQVSMKRAREETPDLKERKLRKRQVTPKLRHDDSQVQFQPIDSSPILDKGVVSQVLTDRQKEVKERQAVEAGMFHNIGSSPLRPHRSSAEAEDSELPTHRSSLLLRSVSRERRPTPTLVTPSDDGFVASSPTPTRSLIGEIAEDGPPSSPPQSSRDLVMSFDEDLPSSSPEPEEEPEDKDFTGSLGPFAQVDSGAANQVVVSTYGSAVDFDGVSSNPLLAPDNGDKNRPEEDLARDGAKVGNQFEISRRLPSQVSPDIEEIEETFLGDPSTPKRQRQTEAIPMPKTPRDTFVDARGSSLSPERPEGDDEVFEDAVSSPSLHIDQPVSKVSSSLLSDLDEASIIRALAEADGQQKISAQVSLSDKANPQEQSQNSSRSNSEQPSVPRSRNLRKAYLVRKDEVGIGSSMPLHFPETPAPMALRISAKLMIDNHALSPDETIFVDDSELYEEINTPRSGTRLKQKTFIAHSRKRKSTEDSEELVNSQEFNREGGSLKSITSRTKKLTVTLASQSSQASAKRGRGRPRKYLRPSQEPGPCRSNEDPEEVTDSQEFNREGMFSGASFPGRRH